MTNTKESLFGPAEYIKAVPEPSEFSYNDPLPFFRKEFCLEQKIYSAELIIQAPSFAKFYINGRSVTDDIFISATSDYEKILWYHTYNVTSLLVSGVNVLGVVTGNGFFNESFATAWDFDSAPWRDSPQFLLCLRVNGEIVAVSDQSWKASLKNSHITFSHLRSGEYVDMRKYDTSWLNANYDDSAWNTVYVRTKPIVADFKPTSCQPVRECERITPVSLIKADDNTYIADFGKTISGYAEITLCEPRDSEILFYYAEELDGCGRPKHNKMDDKHFYHYTPFQHDRMIASGKSDTFKPTFTYHGFRYLRIEGLSRPPQELCAIFTHQDVERRSEFLCGNDVINYIYRAGIHSTYCNMFWCLTDCPTREKLGWTNDAQASTEQVLINFDALPLLKKWYEDIKASMFEDGSLHGTIPSPDWPWGHNCGPVCDCLLYEIPYRVYLYTGKTDMLVEGIPFFKRYIAFLEEKISARHNFILGDWKSNDIESEELSELIAKLFLLKAYDITAFAHKIAKSDGALWEEKALSLRETIAKQYIDSNGECVISMQTAVAMLLHFDINKNRLALENQLISIIERDGYQLRAGMVGFQYIYHVLSDIGKGDIAYRLLTETEPGYKTWFEQGETTLWEEWDGKNSGSHNHHMYSGVISWFFRSLLGISPSENEPAFEKIELKPIFIESLGYAKGSMNTVRGRIEADWELCGNSFIYTVNIPKGITAFFNGQRLTEGKTSFNIPINKKTEV